MPGTGRQTAAVVRDTPIAPAPTAVRASKTRWGILFLISLMYLICYMDRSNISVAQPEIAKAFGLSKGSMGLVLALSLIHI